MDSEEVRFRVLAQLALGRSKHGYSLVEQIKQKQGKQIRLRRIYGELHGLENCGCLTRSTNTKTLAGPAKYDYVLTEKGEELLRQLSQRVVANAMSLLGLTEALAKRIGPGGDGTTGTTT
jgi:DNA-binding PadR family transcriptional regulator